jgi:hypothetical protein
MSVTYSTNFMGPITTHWYRDRGLTRKVREVLEEGRIVYPKGLGPGDVWEYDEVTVHYAGGRIDIYGVPGEHYPLEYGLRVMHGEDWNALSEWLEDLTTDTLLPYNILIEQFEEHYGQKIRWAKD